MRYIFTVIAVFTFCLVANCQVLDKAVELSKKIESVDSLTVIEQLDLDNEIMELQFVLFNEYCEDLRTKLSSKVLIDDAFVETETPIDDEPTDNENNETDGNTGEITEWDRLKNTLKLMSATTFNNAYTEKELVAISATREKLPDWLKSTSGSKKDKVAWFQDNKNEIDNY
mgnify:CR=1 FL=1